MTTELAITGLAFIVGLALARVTAKPRKEPTCTGYIKDDCKDVYGTRLAPKHVDCRALRSDFCDDGRCRAHCKTFCKCEEP